MNILGFNCYGHDSAATLLQDGAITMAVEEERLNRKKHSGDFPKLSIQKCLEAGSIDMADIDHVGFAWDPKITYRKMPVFAFKYFTKVLRLLRESKEWTMEENLGMLNYLKQMRQLPTELKKLSKNPDKVKFKMHFLEHHMCHAASAFFCTPFEEAAIMTIDGAGEWDTAMLAYGKGIEIKKLASVETPHSMGAFYQSISRYLGFALIEGPGKLMGLSSYGNKNSPVYDQMRKLITLTDDGGFKLDMSYFSYHYTRKSGVSEKFIKEFGPPAPQAKDWSQHHLDIAAAVQRIVEDVFLHMANHLYKVTGSKNLCIAGGVGLNSVANGRLVKETPFKEIFIQPAAGDSGTSLGSALYIYHTILKNPRKYVMKHAFLGPEYSDSQIQSEITKSKLPFIKSNSYTAVAAKLLKRGKILGWFQGRIEFGPRALGNRSIIANPCLPEMKDVLNARVKFREGFRPFAPLVLEEECGNYFDSSYPSPYMLKVYNVLEQHHKTLPSITHADGTGRVQTVKKEENPQMYELISAFKKETGVPVLINTSFNVKGEPIVCTPSEALDSFARADMDFLIIGDHVVAKKESDLTEFLDSGVATDTNINKAPNFA